MKRAIVCLAIGVAACAPPPETPQLPTPDPVAFSKTIYPILLSDCAFAGCHGDPLRFFRVHGPGRTRLASDTPPYAPATPDELALSYTRAASMLVSEEGIRRSPLLRKPLAVTAGGAGHEGDDPWGNAVYFGKKAPNWEALFFWALTAEVQGGAP